MVNYIVLTEDKTDDDDDDESLPIACDIDLSKKYGAVDETHSSENLSYGVTTKSCGKFLHTSLSTSVFEKPSDDRKNHTILAAWNVSNLIQGIGILGIPYAVQQGGCAGIAMNFLVAFICCHTGKLLIDCMYEISKKSGTRRRVRVNYPEVGEAVFGPWGLVFVNIVQSIEMFIAVAMYIILLGTGLTDLFKAITPDLGLEEWAAISCAIVLPTLFITKFSVISWLSMISVFALIGAILVLIVFTCTQIPFWSISNIPAFDLQTFPVGFGIIVFSYCGHPVFPSVEGSMTKPHQYNVMMNIVFFIAAIVKACLGTFMVLRFGENTAQVATVNLADHAVFGRLASALLVTNVLVAVPLLMFVVSLSFDDAFLPFFPHMNRESKFHWVWLLISRPILTGLALTLAIMVPYFGLIMGVIGSLTGTCLSFLCPCYFHLRLRWKTLTRWEIVVDFAIIVFGFIAGFSGLALSLKALMLKMME